MARHARGSAVCGAAVLAIVAAILPSAGPARAGASVVPQSAAARGRQAQVVTDQDWPAYLFSARHPSATAGPATIKLGNAGSLQAAWTFHEQPPTGTQPPGGFSASPTVADGMVFIGSQTGDFYALQESTGQVVWQTTLDYQQVGNNGNCNNARGIAGTATVAPDPQTGNLTVYVPGARYLYALDAATGAQKWKSLVGPASSANVVGAYYNYASPTVANGLVYEGVSSSCDNPFVRGGVQAFSQQTGALQHSFWTVPAGHVGASVWSSEAATTAWVWATTGDPEFTGTHLYHAFSFLRLNASTLALSGSWQLKLAQASDLDFGSSPTLFSGNVNGVSTSLVGACNKNGRYYALRRNNLGRGPVWSRRVGAAAHTGHGMCLSSAVWDAQAKRLYLAGNGTSINGKTYGGSVRRGEPRHRLDPVGHRIGLWRPWHPCARCGHRRARGRHLDPMPQCVTRHLSAQRGDRQNPGHFAAEWRRVRPAYLRRPVPPHRGRVRAGRCLHPPDSGGGTRALHRFVQRASPDAGTVDSGSVSYPTCLPDLPK